MTSRSAWAQSSDPKPTVDARRRCFKMRPGETGISFWDIADAERKRLVITGLACGRVVRGNDVDHIDYIVVDESVLVQFGSVVKTRGTSPLSRANDHHYELTCAPAQTDELADALFAKGVIVERYAKADQVELLRELASSDLNPKDFEAVRALLERKDARKKPKQ